MYRGHITREEWGAQPPTQNSGPQAYGQGMVIHWEGPAMWGDLWAFAHDSCYEKVRGIQRYHINVGYSDIAYNDIICPHGYLFNGRTGVGMANAASGDWNVNQNTEAVCFLWGAGDDVLANNPDPIDALNSLRNYLIAFSGMGLEVRPHRGVPGVSTACPGDELAFVAGLLNGSPIQPVNEAPAPTPTPPPSANPILSIGSYGPIVMDWQNWFNLKCGTNLVVDGSFGPATEQAVKDFQSFFGLNVSGVIDDPTWGLRGYLDSIPQPGPTPDPQPTPDPEPPPVIQTPRFNDKDIADIQEVIKTAFEWSFVGKNRTRKLNTVKTLLSNLME